MTRLSQAAFQKRMFKNFKREWWIIVYEEIKPEGVERETFVNEFPALHMWKKVINHQIVLTKDLTPHAIVWNTEKIPPVQYRIISATRK